MPVVFYNRLPGSIKNVTVSTVRRVVNTPVFLYTSVDRTALIREGKILVANSRLLITPKAET